MIVRSATRIALAPGPRDRRRLLGMIGGVAVGVMLAALLWSGFMGLGDRTERSSWVNPSTIYSADAVTWTPQTQLKPTEVAASTGFSVYHGKPINIVYVYGAENPQLDIPGTRDGIRAGSAWVSPALRDLIAEAPADELGDRFGDVVGTLPDRVLAGPDALVAIVGVDEAEVGPNYKVISEFSAARYSSTTYEIIALLGAVAVLIPVLMLLGVVTSIGSVDRSARMRALNLLGATAADRAKFAATEAGLVGFFGAILGLALAWFAAVPVSLISVNGAQFFPADLRLSFVEALVVTVGVPVIFGGIAALRALRTDARPSSVRDRSEPPLGWWRVLPLMGGIALIGALPFVRFDRLYGLLGGFLLIAVGIVTTGPIVTAGIAQVARRFAKKPAGVVAYSRIRNHPRQVFRAVSGVVIAVFLVSLFMSGVTSVRDGEDHLNATEAESDILVVPTGPLQHGAGAQGQDPMVSQIEHLDGVSGLVHIYADNEMRPYASAKELQSVGIDAPGENPRVATFPQGDATFSDGEAAGTPKQTLVGLWVVADDDARERIRTMAMQATPSVMGVMTTGELNTIVDTPAQEYRSLAVLGILVAAGVSAIALAAATISAVHDRRRTLGLLRLTGMPFSVVRGIMMREAVVPLLVAMVGSALLGYGVGAVLVEVLSDRRSVTAPPLDYYVVIAITIALSILAVVAAFPSARRATSGEATRFE